MPQLKIDLIAENLITIYPLLFKTISKPLRSQTSITPGGMFVMGSLKRHESLSMTEIGKYLSMPKPHVTLIVDRLIEEGYVKRQNSSRDRRVINISLTEKGLANFEAIKKEAGKTLKSRLQLLNEEEIATLSIASQQVREILLTILSKKTGK
jgi:DNA-binding MarR family transcriptional regulator